MIAERLFRYYFRQCEEKSLTGKLYLSSAKTVLRRKNVPGRGKCKYKGPEV